MVADVLALAPGAAKQFFDFVKPLIVTIVRRYVGLEDRDHVLNGVLVHIWKANWRVLRKWDGQSPLRGYLAAVVKNFCVDHVRNRPPPFVPIGEDSVSVPDESPHANPAVTDWARRVRECLGRALERLSETYRRIINLRHFEGLSHQEIAVKLGKTVGYVGPTLARAEGYLRQEVLEICPDEAGQVLGGPERTLGPHGQ